MAEVDRDLLVRTSEQVTVIHDQITDIKTDISRLDDRFVTHVEFSPVQKIVYGIVGAVLLAVIGGVLAVVLK